jgi:hypothetical protein
MPLDNWSCGQTLQVAGYRIIDGPARRLDGDAGDPG